MALIAIITASAFASLTPELQKEYALNASGAYQLQVTPVGGFALEDVTGLKTTMEKEMALRKDHEKKLASFEGLDPLAAREALKKVDDMKSWKPEDKVKEQLQQAQAELKKQFDANEKLLKDRADRLQAQLADALVGQASTKALADRKGSVELLSPHVQRLTRMVEQNGKMVVEVFDPQTGNARVSVKNGQPVPMSIEDLVDEMRANPVFGKAFDASGTTGSGASGMEGSGAGSGTGSGAGILRISRRDQKSIDAHSEQIKTGKAIVTED